MSPQQDDYRYDAFVSYELREDTDRDWVDSVFAPHLRRNGLSLYLQPDPPWVDDVARALVNSRYAIAVLTPTYVHRLSQFPPLARALASMAADSRCIPLYLRNCQVPAWLRAVAILDVSNSELAEDKLEQLAMMLRTPLRAIP